MISISVAIISIIIILVGLLTQPSLVLIVGLCTGYQIWEVDQKPKHAVEALIQGIRDEDEAVVRSLASDRLQQGIDRVFSSNSGEGGLRLFALLDETTVSACSILNDTMATCRLCVAGPNNCNDLILVRENDRWVVDFSK